MIKSDNLDTQVNTINTAEIVHTIFIPELNTIFVNIDYANIISDIHVMYGNLEYVVSAKNIEIIEQSKNNLYFGYEDKQGKDYYIQHVGKYSVVTTLLE